MPYLVVLVDVEVDEKVALGRGHVHDDERVLVRAHAHRLHRRHLDRLRKIVNHHGFAHGTGG